ncbi:hypothetical protein L1887_33044 [Cichorium endivia]|nr:hypothetical protein L1887_33044 [Cichorium endivia]
MHFLTSVKEIKRSLMLFIVLRLSKRSNGALFFLILTRGKRIKSRIRDVEILSGFWVKEMNKQVGRPGCTIVHTIPFSSRFLIGNSQLTIRKRRKS